MTKDDVAAVLEEIGTMLELKGENPFKCRAYFNAARTLSSSTADLSALVAEDRLGEIPGLGEALCAKITTLVQTGRLPYHEELKASFPPGLLDLLKIPGLGPKKVRAVHEKLGVNDTDALEQACRDGRVAGLAGFGKKTAANILAGIDQIRSYAHQHRYGDVAGLADDLIGGLRDHPDVIRISIAGSLRRGKEVIKDVDIIASAKRSDRIMEAFTSLPNILRVLNHGETKSSVLLEGGVQCDLRVVEDFQYPYALHHFTGSKEHNVALRQRAISRGLKMSEWGLFKLNKDGTDGDLVPCRDEKELFAQLGLEEIPPELRENLGEIEAAEEGRLPRLIEWTDLRGCFHNHTRESDGRATLEEMAAAAEELGFDYLGLADHSKSSVQAHGLSEERLLAQVDAIHAHNQTKPACHLFTGVECDILKDGSLDFPDAVLARLDYVVASVHAAFTMDGEEMTRRVIRAMENPHVTMLGHATGRLLLQREPYDINLGKIIDAAAATGTWIELNANPWRLDMDWRWWKTARDKGVLCAINPDAHDTPQLGYVKIGVGIARKGWLRKEDVVNTLPLKAVREKMAAKRKRFGL
jgi:DNA polymerase (family 10)